MALSETDVRVLAALIEREALAADGEAVSLNSLRLSCNQRHGRRPIVEYDDRTVEAALLSLSSIGLVRFVQNGGREVGYRQTADERWRLTPNELRAWAMLALGGDQTADELSEALRPLRGPGETTTVVELLDTLAARSPDPLARRLPGGRWTAAPHDGPVVATPTGHSVQFAPPPTAPKPAATSAEVAKLGELNAMLAEHVARLEVHLDQLALRVEALERDRGRR